MHVQGRNDISSLCFGIDSVPNLHIGRPQLKEVTSAPNHRLVLTFVVLAYTQKSTSWSRVPLRVLWLLHLLVLWAWTLLSKMSTREGMRLMGVYFI